MTKMQQIDVWFADPSVHGPFVERGWYFDAPRDIIGPYRDREEAVGARNCYFQNLSYFMNGANGDSFCYLPG